MFRVVHLGGKTGVITISDNPERSCVEVEIDFPDSSQILVIASRVRALFDLDSDPLVIANSIETNPRLKTLLAKHSGIRLASGWDAFEVAVQAILGQLVSVERGRALVNDLIRELGEEVTVGARRVRLFPSVARIARADLSFLGSTRARKSALQSLAQAIVDGRLSLDPEQDPEEFTRKLLAIKGIGPWTANYIALRGLRHIDAFPETDLILARALKKHSRRAIESMRPWRGYVAALLWREYAASGAPG